jgi:hypothetical protein
MSWVFPHTGRNTNLAARHKSAKTGNPDRITAAATRRGLAKISAGDLIETLDSQAFRESRPSND